MKKTVIIRFFDGNGDETTGVVFFWVGKTSYIGWVSSIDNQRREIAVGAIQSISAE